MCQNNFHSTVTNTSFLFHHKESFSCKSKNIIYLITCSTCSVQYVGLTQQHLHERVNGHRASVKSGKNLYIYQHFNQEGHSFDDATIQIIDYVGASSNNIKLDLHEREKYWIDTLCTAHPLGLNDNIKGVGNISKSSISNIYFHSPIKRYNRGHGRKKRYEKMTFTEKDIEKEIKELKKNLELNQKTLLYRKLKSFRKCQLLFLQKLCSSGVGNVYNLIASFAHAIFPHKTVQPRTQKPECIIFPYSSKAIDALKLNSVIKDTRIQGLLPPKILPFCPLNVFYTFDIPLGRRISNYNTFLKELETADIRNILDNDCSCQSSPFLYEPRGHVITGDLQIASNSILRTYMSYGMKYREPMYQEAPNLLESLYKSIDDFVEKKSKKYKTQAIHFETWKKEVKKILDNRINYLNDNSPELFSKSKSILKDSSVKGCLDELQDKYIICPIDKASNNYVFVCKKYYLTTLMSELGIDLQTLNCVGNTTYQPVTDTPEDIIDYHCRFLHDNFNITVKEENKCIPRIFWNPKLHKTPYKARYIAGARHCTTKQLSVFVNKALKVLRESFSKYCAAIYRNSGINCDWSINSSTQFLEKIKKIDAFNMQVYDFTTLYTNLDLEVVEGLMNGLIDLIFSESNKYICVSRFDEKCFFAKKQYNGYLCFSSESLKKAINFILQNTYIRYSTNILRQVRGIPMGGNSSSQLADLSLAKCEYDYMQSLLKAKKLGLAKLLSNNSRYVDDLIIINYLGFEALIPQIYPPDLKMERSGDDNKVINYLDINISIEPSSISTNIYNKVDDFNFPVVMYTFPHGNMPVSIGYNVFYGQCLRYSIICSQLSYFISAVNKLYNILLSRGYRHSLLYLKFNTLLKNKPNILLKYRILDVKDIEKDIFKR